MVNVQVRNRSIDALKGILILAVVVGHILPGTLDENPLRYLIYSFHMPAFFFVSGYLLNLDKLRVASFGDTIRKYWHRMLLPWCIAWVIYTLYVLNNNFSLLALLHNICSPYYHLWFVPSLFLCIIICTLVVKYQKNNLTAEVFLVSIGMFLYSIHYSKLGKEGVVCCKDLIFLMLGVMAKRLCCMPVEFWGGKITLLFCILLVLVFDMVLGIKITEYRSFFQLPLCMILCIYCFLPMIVKNKLRITIFEFWGRKSLEIYLWHVIPILGIKHYFMYDTSIYYMVSFVTLTLFMLGSHYYCKRINR